MSFFQMVTFDLCGEEYAVDISNVNGIVKWKNYSISKIPNAPEELEGIMDLRGKVSPVFNLKKKFKLDIQSIGDESKIVIMNNHESVIGFIVDEVTDIFRLREEEIEPFPSCVNKEDCEYIRGIGKVGDRMILILDLIQLLSSSDIPHIPSLPAATAV
jgi:purine-binding chemotaxis protein CheW